MRCHLRRLALCLAFCCFGACIVMYSAHLAALAGLELRDVEGREYAEYAGAENSNRTPDCVTSVALTTTTVPEYNLTNLHPWLPDARNTLPNYFTRRNASDTEDHQYQDGILVYLHLNKAAGSTTKRCLASVAAGQRRTMGPILDSAMRVRVQTQLGNGGKQFSTHMGGYAFGICDAVRGKNCSYFTVLRDPYERLISSFTYCRRAGLDQTCRALGPWDVSLKGWAVHQGNYFFRQLLMKPWFCTIKNQKDPKFKNLDGIPHSRQTTFANSPCWYKEKVILNRSLTRQETDELLQYCVDHLEEWFAMIGLTDEYDLSLAMLEEIYKLPFQKTCTGKRINVSDYRNLTEEKESNKTDMVSKWKEELQADSEVYEALRADIVLYETAKEIFERQKSAFLETYRT